MTTFLKVLRHSLSIIAGLMAGIAFGLNDNGHPEQARLLIVGIVVLFALAIYLNVTTKIPK